MKFFMHSLLLAGLTSILRTKFQDNSINCGLECSMLETILIWRMREMTGASKFNLRRTRLGFRIRRRFEISGGSTIIYNSWFKVFNMTRHSIKSRKNDRSGIMSDTRLEEILVFKENYISRNAWLISVRIVTHKPFMYRTVSHESTLSRLSLKLVTFSRW